MTPSDDLPGAAFDNGRLVHQFKNHLAVIVGFCDLLRDDLPPGDSRLGDVAEIRKAAQAATDLLPELNRRLD
jgi:hypothetical protein